MTAKKYIIEIGAYVSIPLAGMIMSDLGYEVIKIEPLEGDPSRKITPPSVGGISGYFISVNRNKKFMSIDLARPEGLNIFLELARHAFAIITNLSGTTLANLKINYERIKSINAGIIYVQVNGFREGSTERELKAFDGTVMSLSGILKATGEDGREPVKFPLPYADITSALFVVITLINSLATNKNGIKYTVPMLDVVTYLSTFELYNVLLTGEDPKRLGSSHSNIVPYRTYKTKDNEVFVAVASNTQFQYLCDALKIDDIVKYNTNEKRLRNRQLIDKRIQEKIITLSTKNVETLFKNYGVPCAPVQGFSEMIKSLYFKEYVRFKQIQDTNIPFLPFPIQSIPKMDNLSLPILGSYNNTILREIGYTKEKIDELQKSGIIL